MSWNTISVCILLLPQSLSAHNYDHDLYSSVFETSTIGSDSSFTLSTDHLVVTFDGSTGLLQSIRKHDSSDRIVNTNVDFVVYPSSKSGAYLFLPDGGPQVTIM